MSKSKGVYLYYDLDGRQTGEFRIECDCRPELQHTADGQSIRLGCSCAGESQDASSSSGGCGLVLTARRVAGSRIQLLPECIGGEHGCGPCRERRVTTSDATVTVLHAGTAQATVRSERFFRCECVDIHSPEVRTFYQHKIGAIVSFAVRRGMGLNPRDLFHAHVITDVLPERQDADGEWIFDEQFMLDHYRGLLSHAHDYDDLKSDKEDNFNIYLEGDDAVRFVGSTADVYGGDPRIVPGQIVRSIYFRWCGDGEECPPCTTKVWCADLGRALCVGLRQRWPEGDPALSW